MEKLVIGAVVVISFPFSNLKGIKRRPALVVAKGEFDNVILCQITSKSYTSQLAVMITASDFSDGGLSVKSYARPDKLFTADPALIERTVGKLNDTCLKQIMTQIHSLFLFK